MPYSRNCREQSSALQTLANDQRPTTSDCTYSVIIPAYNERARIRATLDRVLAYASERGWNAEIIVVNDGSRDDTAEIARKYAAVNSRLRLLENPGNRGKGYSVRNGSARGGCAVICKASGSHSTGNCSAEFLI